MWILFFDSCSISIGILPLRGEGCLHIPLYTRYNGISQVITSRWFTRNLSARFFPREKKFYQYVRREGVCPRFQRNMVRVVKWNCAPLALCKKMLLLRRRAGFIAPPLPPCYALRSCVIKGTGIFGVGSCPLTRKSSSFVENLYSFH